MKEVRKINVDKVRSMCIRNDYYTHGTNRAYMAMFEKCRVENPTTEDFAIIAEDIFDNSDRAGMKERTGLSSLELVKGIMFELINDCTTVFIED